VSCASAKRGSNWIAFSAKQAAEPSHRQNRQNDAAEEPCGHRWHEALGDQPGHMGRVRAESHVQPNFAPSGRDEVGKDSVEPDGRESEVSQAQALKQAESQLLQTQAALQSTLAQEQRSKAILGQSRAQHEQSENAVTTLEPLINQRGAKMSAIDTARYNLNNCRVYAPFDARITNLTISEGAYAHVGQQMFVLIDARTWWAVANFREGQLQHIAPGMRADVYVLSKPNERFSGVVNSIGFGVTPDADVVGRFE
jgi:hypothetical protein